MENNDELNRKIYSVRNLHTVQEILLTSAHIVSGIFVQAGKQPGGLAFLLQAQADDGVHAFAGGAQVVEDFNRPMTGFSREQGARSAQPDFGSQCVQQADVGTGHPAMGNITHNKYSFVLKTVPQG